MSAPGDAESAGDAGHARGASHARGARDAGDAREQGDPRDAGDAREQGDPRDARAAALWRLLNPKSVAVVGASETNPNAGLVQMLSAGPELFLVNARRATVFGRVAYPSLAALGHPVDAVLSLVGAAAAVDVVAQAAALGVGGVVVIADGFDPAGPLQAALTDAAGTAMAVLGPNCNGLVNVRRGSVLSAAPALVLRPGGVGLISQSGGYLAPLANGARARGIGLSQLVTTGNEAVTDASDYLEALIDDEDTRVIALVLEIVRRPSAFAAAAARARAVGKPLVALKLGRSAAAREIARTHSGALVGDHAAYRAAFRQLAVIEARDGSDLLDRVSMFEQLPPRRWGAMRGIAALSTSGGMAALAGDVCDEEGIELPALASLAGDVARLVGLAAAGEPAPRIVNPADLTGFVGRRPALLRELLDLYLGDRDVDALLFVWLLDEGSGEWAPMVVDPLLEAAGASDKAVVLASVEDGELADWARALTAGEVALGRGLRGALRGLDAVGQFARARDATPWRPANAVAALPAPPALVAGERGPAPAFGSVMRLLADAGIPVAPFELVAARTPAELVRTAFAEPLALKLAEVPHRSEHAAVRLGVPSVELASAIVDLRRLAADLAAPAEIVIQPQLAFDAEAFLGIQASDFGPLVVCGIGGTAVELHGAPAARVAPFGRAEAAALVGELDPRITAGFRGAPAWELEELAAIVAALGRFALASAGWLASLDVNPLVHAADGFVAVDAVAVLKD
jgi:acyl-CoA synthetase (NDP forming)